MCGGVFVLSNEGTRSHANCQVSIIGAAKQYSSGSVASSLLNCAFVHVTIDENDWQGRNFHFAISADKLYTIGV